MSKWEKGWTRLEKFTVGILALSATLISFWAVIARYLLHNPPDWGEEVATYLLIWAVFIVASTLAEERGHLAATLIVERFSLKTRRTLAIMNGLLALGFCGLMGIYAYRIVFQAFIFGDRSLTALRVPLWICYLSIAAGLTLIGLRYCVRLYRLLFQFKESHIQEIHELSREDKPV